MHLKYWAYFLSLDEDLVKCSRYVDFTLDNFRTHSIEFARIILAASSELENVLKDLCREIDFTQAPKKLPQMRPVVLREFPNFQRIQVALPRFRIVLEPWIDWTDREGPLWWRDGYNALKHSRSDNYREASLYNALCAVAGLFVGILYYHKLTSNGLSVEERFTPRLFDVTADGIIVELSGMVCGYNLP